MAKQRQHQSNGALSFQSKVQTICHSSLKMAQLEEQKQQQQQQKQQQVTPSLSPFKALLGAQNLEHKSEAGRTAS